MVSHVVIQLIGETTMRAGLTVNAKLDKRQHRTNVKVPTEDKGLRKLRTTYVSWE